MDSAALPPAGARSGSASLPDPTVERRSPGAERLGAAPGVPRQADRPPRADPAVLPRRTGGTEIPPPREPVEVDDGPRWSTDLGTLRRLADGLRRRLR